MDDPTAFLHQLVEKLTIEQPWENDSEAGLVACWFCNSDTTGWRPERHAVVYIHSDGCPWLDACDYLGREHPDHIRLRDRSAASV